MAALLQQKPLTIKQQVEELKNWHKQQQSKLYPETKEISSNYINEIEKDKKVTMPSCDSNSNPKINFDEIPINVANSNFDVIVENNFPPINSYLEKGKSDRMETKPKFRFLKKGEGIARFNMGPPKAANKVVPRRNIGLKLTRDSTKCDTMHRNEETANKTDNIDSENGVGIATLKAPDLKLNFTWKSILSAGNPEDMLEKAISSNQIDLMDPNSSIDSSTASLMEKLLAIGKKKLLRDKEELRVFETIEQHMLDSSFCSTSSYVNKLMENAVISTPNKETVQDQQSQTCTSKSNDQLLCKLKQNCSEGITQQKDLSQTNNPTSFDSNKHDKTNKMSNAEEKMENQNTPEENRSQPVAIWTKPGTIGIEEYETTVEESFEDLEQSLHVRFAEHIDYKSFIEQSQSIGSISQREENMQAGFDESQEWKECSEDRSSCCSQCSNHESLADDVRPHSPQDNQLQNNQSCLQNEKSIPLERLHVGDLKTNEICYTQDPSSNDGLNNFPPLLIEKLKELEEEIKVFREQNNNIRTLRESLERERRIIQEEKRRLHLEKKKIQKEVEEEKKRLITQVEEEKQKLAKEKIIFEKYSKSLTKNPSRDERKEIQALREQLTEMKEELNKKESRWGAAQARVRNQVKVLEQDNKKLREEIENFRKQAKYWELFNQKKKGKPFNNTKLIHAISEHISNIVLDEEVTKEKCSRNYDNSIQSSSAPKTSSLTQSDLKNMYGIKVVKENKISTLPSDKNLMKPIVNFNSEDDVSKGIATDGVNISVDTNEGRINEASSSPSNSPRIAANFPISQIPTQDEISTQNEDRCQKPSLEEDSNNTIKEVADGNGNVEIIFPNGNIKKINKITGSEKYIYVNGDVEEITHDGTVKYYYSKSRIWQTTLPDGLEIVDFPDGKVEKRHIDGTVEIIYSNNNKKISYPDYSQEIIYTDGTRLKIEPNKTQILTLPNGQKEIHTEEWKRREYPDGTMKTLYPDGTTETVYSNGRVRLKDKYGNLVMDSGSPQFSDQEK